MATCVRCGNEVGGISSLFTFNRKTGRCKNCEAATQQALIHFREAFLRCSSDGNFTAEKLQQLADMASYERIDMQEALAFIRADALTYLDRILQTLVSQGSFTDEAEEYIRNLQSLLAVPDTAATHLLRGLTFLNIYRGKFPIVSLRYLQDIRLESDETCYLLTPATYYKMNTSSIKPIPGRLIATNKKLLFLSEEGGSEILWNSVMSIKRQTKIINQQAGSSAIPRYVTGIYLELNKKSSNGFYTVVDPEMVEAIIDTSVRIAKRQLVKIGSENERCIPQHVKIAVWQRDQGKCVQCGATDYLEFDHIIPYSKGGASTENNIQLLCRRCNPAKSDLI